MEMRYLENWAYQAARILDALEKLVVDNGGELVSTWAKTKKPMMLIQNRTLSTAVFKQTEHVERLHKMNRPAYQEQQLKLNELLRIENSPVASRYGDWLYMSFSLNGFYYIYNMDRNPFFPFTFSKIHMDNGSINPDHYAQDDEKGWLIDDLWGIHATQQQREDAALKIYNLLVKAKPGRCYHSSAPLKKLIPLKDN